MKFKYSTVSSQILFCVPRIKRTEMKEKSEEWCPITLT